MSKKKFKAGLESLFGEIAVEGMTPYLVEDKQPKETETIVKKSRSRSSSKNFTADLETLFSDALDKEYKEQKNTPKSVKGKQTEIKKRSDKPIIGLDALIRKTIKEKKGDIREVAALKKRLTITLEKKKLEQLKLIAKEKKTYLRTLIDELVSEYLSNQSKTAN